jgi:phage gpG-like protein
MGNSSEFGLNLPNELTKYEIQGTAKIGFSANIKSTSNISGIGSGISRKLRNVDAEFTVILDQILREAISSSTWQLRNGGSGDIIDSGALLASQSVTNTGSGLNINYDVPYAALIHYGGYIVPYGNKNAQRVYIPARPWVSTVLGSQFNGYDMYQIYRNLVTAVIKNL